MNISKELAQNLLKIKAVTLTNTDHLFTWASGIQSPIYCDNRLTMSYPNVRNKIAEGFQTLIENHFSDVEVIVGTATAGIPHAAWVAEKMDLPMAYVRSSAKGHGKGNQIEGIVKKGQKVVVVEDLLSTGGSSMKAVQALIEAGAEVLGVVAIFTYGFDKVDEVFSKENIPYYTLTNYETLLPTAIEMGYLKEEDQDILKRWSKDPYIFTK